MSQTKYLVTGGVGFLGKYITKSILEAGHICYTLQRTASNETDIKNIVADISKDFFSLGDKTFDVVIHAAGKAHLVPKTEVEAEEFHQVNAEGTRRLLGALNKLPSLPKQFVLISTVSVYGLDTGQLINESQSLNSKEPYGKSKIEAEREAQIWGSKNNVPVLILRLPLIVGYNPPGNLGAMISGIKSGKYLRIGNGEARKSMVLATDVAQVILNNADKAGIYNLTDRNHPNFAELEDQICKVLNLKPVKRINQKQALWLGMAGNAMQRLSLPFPINSRTITKIMNPLTFDDSLAVKELNWSPNKVLDHIKEVVN
ncbi:MAG: NAD-dependent epimerase/dehydratase family protein [Bacteroidota bacterium]|nr:NAD-dependent epimerase/dehydratase family protein [Bacteroidota bacterium]